VQIDNAADLTAC